MHARLDITMPRRAIRCNNPSCSERGRVLAETTGPVLVFVDIAAGVRAYTFHPIVLCCPVCAMARQWRPVMATVPVLEVVSSGMT